MTIQLLDPPGNDLRGTHSPVKTLDDSLLQALWTATSARTWVRQAATALYTRNELLAEAMGCAQGTLSNYLAGRRDLSDRLQKSLLTAFGLPPEAEEQLRCLLSQEVSSSGTSPATAESPVAQWARAAPLNALPEGLKGLISLLDAPRANQSAEIQDWRDGPELPASERQRVLAEAQEASITALSVLPREVRDLRLAFAAAPDRLMPVLRLELRRLHLFAQQLERAPRPAGGAPPQVMGLLSQMFPLTIPIGDAAPAQPPSALLSDPVEDVLDLRRSLDVRSYVRAYVQEEKLSQEALHQRLRTLLNEEAPGRAQIGHILGGLRQIDPPQAWAWAQVLELDALDTELFILLVEMRACKTEDERERLQQRVLSFPGFVEAMRLPAKARRFDEDWVHSTLLEMVSCRGFREDSEHLAACFIPPLDPAQVRRSLDLLLELGLLERGPKGKVTRAAGLALRAIGPVLLRESVVKLHRGLVGLSERSHAQQPPGHRAHGLTLVRLAPDQIVELRSQLYRTWEFMQGLCDSAVRGFPGSHERGIKAQVGRPADRVVVVTLALWPLTDPGRSSEGLPA